jgi:hypothetical protein
VTIEEEKKPNCNEKIKTMFACYNKRESKIDTSAENSGVVKTPPSPSSKLNTSRQSPQ